MNPKIKARMNDLLTVIGPVIYTTVTYHFFVERGHVKTAIWFVVTLVSWVAILFAVRKIVYYLHHRKN
ncbi:hypothetical protein [Lapidilactobacillus bayanensis]|uniref:hypothetical protein n=1 Tax=Lapidilactobacillus bayanensis TaxID=2485998 RepID=UPI000F7749AD|nr:hypothetical protein [Lapidilactobacillus bayanensis]